MSVYGPKNIGQNLQNLLDMSKQLNNKNFDSVFSFVKSRNAFLDELKNNQNTLPNLIDEINLTIFLVNTLPATTHKSFIESSLLNLIDCLINNKPIKDLFSNSLTDWNLLCEYQIEKATSALRRDTQAEDKTKQIEDSRHNRELNAIQDAHLHRENERHEREIQTIHQTKSKEIDRHNVEMAAIQNTINKIDSEKSNKLKIEIDRHQQALKVITTLFDEENKRHNEESATLTLKMNNAKPNEIVSINTKQEYETKKHQQALKSIEAKQQSEISKNERELNNINQSYERNLSYQQQKLTNENSRHNRELDSYGQKLHNEQLRHSQQLESIKKRESDEIQRHDNATQDNARTLESNSLRHASTIDLIHKIQSMIQRCQIDSNAYPTLTPMRDLKSKGTRDDNPTTIEFPTTKKKRIA